jgi:hypothetical protein
MGIDSPDSICYHPLQEAELKDFTEEKGPRNVGFSRRAWVRNPPPPPFHKGGPKVTDGEFLKYELKCLLPNKSAAAQAFVVNIFATVE